MFRGRAPRSEYWWFYLFTVIVGLVGEAIDYITGFGVAATGFSFAFLAPTLAAGARRLHDSNVTGWWQALPLAGTPFFFISINAGIIAILILSIGLLYLLVRRGTEGDNRFGPDPLRGPSERLESVFR
ncbi:MAG: DUF805 domain-containing protein [Pseudomonadota bacterium]